MSETSIDDSIGTLNEGDLHSALKFRYADDESQAEQRVGRFVVDIVKPDRLIEIQTRKFGMLRRKLPELLKSAPVTLVHPISERKTIVKIPSNGPATRRLSPKRGKLADLYTELVAFPNLLELDGLDLEIVFVHEEEHQTFHGSRGRRRRGWIVAERHLVEVLSTQRFGSTRELLAQYLPHLPDQFTTEDLALAMNRNRNIAQRAAYCFRSANVVEVVAKRGNALVYQSV